MENINERDQVEGQPMTTEEIKKTKEWPEIEKDIYRAMEETKSVISAKKIELIQETFRWIVVADGEAIMEILPRNMTRTN